MLPLVAVKPGGADLQVTAWRERSCRVPPTGREVWGESHPGFTLSSCSRCTIDGTGSAGW